MEAESNGHRHAPVWKIWANPIVRRYARARLRPRGLGVSLLITMMLAGFLFFLTRGLALYRAELLFAERAPIIPLLFFQGFVLFVLGTGQAAAGMTQEADEQVIDYQRLAPMTPLAKVIGYLFGLPIREYVAFFSTLPFTLWAVWRGQVPISIAVQLYLVFLLAGVLYHLTGLVAGTVVKNRRWAFLVSMGLVFVLYTIIPQAAKVGLVYFKYVTIDPVVREWWPHLVPGEIGAMGETLQRILPTARFFDLNLPQAIFTVVTQAVLGLALVVMLWRHWHRAESHLLGKAGATGLFAWIQIMLLGNALPLIDRGDVFPSHGLRFVGYRGGDYTWSPAPSEPIAMAGAYGLVTLLILWLMIALITPDRDGQIRGWRRARKLGRRSLSFGSDPASSFPWVAAMVAMGTAGWFWFTKNVIESDWFGGTAMPTDSIGAFVVVLAVGGFGFHALLEGYGVRSAALFAILGGTGPVLLGAILGASNDALAPVATWVLGMSPAAAPLYAAASVLPVADLPVDLARSVPRAFWFWQIVGVLLAVNLVLHLRRARSAIAKQTALIPDERADSLD